MGRETLLHACTLLRIVEQLPNLESLKIACVSVQHCPHSHPCRNPSGTPRKARLEVLHLNNVRLSTNSRPECFDVFEVFQYLLPKKYSLILCNGEHSPNPPRHTPLSVTTLVCNFPGGRLLSKFEGALGIKELRVWPGSSVSAISEWYHTKTIIANNRWGLESIFLGANAMSGACMTFLSHKSFELTSGLAVHWPFRPALPELGLARCRVLKHACLALRIPYDYLEAVDDIWYHVRFWTRSMPHSLRTLKIVMHFQFRGASLMDVIEAGRWDYLQACFADHLNLRTLELVVSGHVNQEAWRHSEQERNGAGTVCPQEWLAGTLRDYGISGAHSDVSSCLTNS